MRRTRVKVCGMRDPSQVQQLVDLGVDAIGMIFYSGSSRNVTIEQAQQVRRVVPAFVDLVGVFVDTSVAEINDIAAQVKLDLIQLHGDQNIEFAEQLSRPYIKVIRVDHRDRIEQERQKYPQAQGFLLDTFSQSVYGGTGHRIAEELLPEQLPEKTILAGGINLDNIAAVLQHKPYAVDINSGVELAPADKDISLMQVLLKEIHKFDDENC